MSQREATILPESQQDIHIDCDTQGLISLAMILVAAGWDARNLLGEERHGLTMDEHRKLALEAVAAIKLAALSKQRKQGARDKYMQDLTEGASPGILGLDGEPVGT